MLGSGGSILGQFGALGGGVLGALWPPSVGQDPKMSQKVPKIRPKLVQEGPKAGQSAARMPQNEPKELQRVPRWGKKGQKENMEAFYEGLVAETQHFVILAPLCSENLTLEGLRVPSWSHLGSKMTSGGGRDSQSGLSGRHFGAIWAPCGIVFPIHFLMPFWGEPSGKYGRAVRQIRD